MLPLDGLVRFLFFRSVNKKEFTVGGKKLSLTSCIKVKNEKNRFLF